MSCDRHRVGELAVSFLGLVHLNDARGLIRSVGCPWASAIDPSRERG